MAMPFLIQFCNPSHKRWSAFPHLLTADSAGVCVCFPHHQTIPWHQLGVLDSIPFDNINPEVSAPMG